MAVASRFGAITHPFRVLTLLNLVAIVGLLSLAPVRIMAQLNSATLHGSITDSSGASVPGAAVTITNVDTSTVRSSVSNDAGDYSVSALQPGEYSVAVAKAGFSTSKRSNIKLDVGQAANLSFSLQVGNVAQTVEVATSASAIDSSDATLGTVIGQQQVVDLPLNGRQFSQLLQLAPGTVPIDNSQNAGKAPNFGAGAASPGVDGQSNRSNIFFLDGIIASNPFFGGFSFSPSIDAIQEFKAQSHTDQAEFGQSTGAVVSVVSRPGTNTLHGSVFEFVRNNIFDTQNKFSPKKLPYHQNQFGASVGGPILKDKLFFFANYEGGRQVQPLPSFNTVPTLAERSGDFSGVLPGGLSPVIYDPATYNPTTYTETAFAGNKIPSSRINAGMLAYLNALYPAPNVATSNGVNNFLATTGNRTIGDQGTLRIDYTLGAHDTFNGRYSQNNASVSSPSALENIFTTGFNGKNTGGNWTHTYSPTLISDITVAYNNLNIPQQIVIPVDQDALFTSSGLGAGFPKNPGLTPFTLVPDIGLNGGSYSGFWNGAGPIGPMNIIQVSGSVSKTEGKHSLKFGGSYYKTSMYTNWSGNNFQFSNKGTWNAACQNVASNPTALAQCPTYNAKAGDLGGGGDPIASLLLSLPIGATRNLGNTGVNLRQSTIGLFAQDTWQVTPKLTLNYGLRWDYSTPMTESNNRLAVYDIANRKYLISKGDVDLPSTPLPVNVVVSSRSSITKPYYSYFQPRLGLAYQVNPRTIVRAGLGRSFDMWGLPLQVGQQNRGAWPSGVAQQASSQSLNIAGISLKPDNTVYTAQNPFYGPAVLPASPLPAGGLGFQDINWQTASAFQWNAEVQQDLKSIGVLSIAYVGSETEHSTINDPYNVAPASTNSIKAFPDTIFGGVGSVLASVGTAKYQSLQTKLSRTFANGLTYNTAFTWAKTQGLAVCGGDFYASCVQNPNNLRADYGLTDLDVPFIFTFNASYQLPFGRGKQFLATGPGAVIFGNWQVNTLVAARSGQVINPSNGANGDTANAGGGNQRVTFVGDPNSNAPHKLTGWFNASAFALPATGTYGTAGINSLRGPGYWNADFSVFRNIPFTERIKLQLRAEAFDIFNHPNLGQPNGNFGGGGFNTITSTVSGPGANRDIQLAAKLLF